MRYQSVPIDNKNKFIAEKQAWRNRLICEKTDQFVVGTVRPQY